VSLCAAAITRRQRSPSHADPLYTSAETHRINSRRSRSPEAPRVDLVTVLRPAPPPVHAADHPACHSSLIRALSKLQHGPLYLFRQLSRPVARVRGRNAARRRLPPCRPAAATSLEAQSTPKPSLVHMWITRDVLILPDLNPGRIDPRSTKFRELRRVPGLRRHRIKSPVADTAFPSRGLILDVRSGSPDCDPMAHIQFDPRCNGQRYHFCIRVPRFL